MNACILIIIEVVIIITQCKLKICAKRGHIIIDY